jgi:hypothetical protein
MVCVLHSRTIHNTWDGIILQRTLCSQKKAGHVQEKYNTVYAPTHEKDRAWEARVSTTAYAECRRSPGTSTRGMVGEEIDHSVR